MRSCALFFTILPLVLPLSAAADFDPDLEDGPPAAPAAPKAPEAPVPPKAPEAPAPRAPVRSEPYAEAGPRDLRSYLDAGKTPSYIRVDMKGYNVRTTPDFSAGTRDNIDFRTKGGDLYVVEDLKPLVYGAAVQIHVKDDLRWIYVPYKNKNDFQFCESAACFTAMASTLDYLLKGSGVNVAQAQDCGVTSGPEGLILPKGAGEPHKEPEKIPLPPRRPPPPAPARPAMSAKPLWETAKGKQGEAWTRMMGESLDKWGQGLLNQRNLSDARAFCPNFSKLSKDQKKEFWTHLFAGIAQSESSFHTTTPAFDETTHRNVFRGPIRPGAYSMGLFQLSYSSAPGYRPGCRIDWGKDRGKDVSDPSLTIYDVKTQMDCAVTVMNRWVTRDGGVGLSSSRGGARFWSTLRSSNPATQHVIGSLKRDTACWK